MRIHPEGHRLLFLLASGLILLNLLLFWLWPAGWIITAVLSLILFSLVLQFFRHPRREVPLADNNLIYSPADGKVVVIEEAYEPEFFQDRRLQISIFMSPFDVHVNRNPVGGEVRFLHHHSGRYLVAWHAKASTENERSTIVLNNGRQDILLRQIAGAMAKRVKTYLRPGQQVEQGGELGFITFGSRADIFLPLDAEVEVSMGQQVYGGLTVLARLKDDNP